MLASLMYEFVLRFAGVKFEGILSDSSTGILADNNTLVHFCYPTEHISWDFFLPVQYLMHQLFNALSVLGLCLVDSLAKKFVLQKYEEKDLLMLVPPKYMVLMVQIIRVSSIRIS